MPRHPRLSSPLNIYHIVVKGLDRQLIFLEPADYQKFLKLLEVSKESSHFSIYAFCLMSNHVHLLIKTNEISTSEIFHYVNGTYSQWFNRKYDRTGPLFKDRYYSEPVLTERQFLNTVRYIHQNPQKGGIESVVGSQYQWTSFQDYQFGATHLIDPDPLLSILDNRKSFVDFVREKSDEVFLDIDQKQKRLPDDVARAIIQETCHCNSPVEFQKLSIDDQKKYIVQLHKKRVSIRQLNRLAGPSKGFIEKVLRENK